MSPETLFDAATSVAVRGSNYVVIEITEIVVQIFGPHQPVADCVFNPAARRPTPQGLPLVASQTARRGIRPA